MPIYRDKENDCWRFEFDRILPGAGRVRARKRLPRAWSRADAEAFDRQETARLYALASGAAKPAAGIEQAVALYLQERAPELKHPKRMAQELGLVYWAYKGKSLAQLAEVTQAIRRKWAGELAPATIRNRIRNLASACRWAYKHHALCDHDPAERVTVPKVDNERHTYTDRAGMLRICLATQCRQTRIMVRVGFYSGMRLAEIFRAEVDHAAGLFKLSDTKNGEPRWVPIHARIRSTAKRLPLQAARSTLEKRWRIARDAAGMGHLHFHDLRHSTASEMINAKVDLFTVGAVLGHKSTQSTKRYAHLATHTLANALDRVGKKRA